ncbi:MAG: hypothetical protein M1817_000192 [Caeruleum heppii]|nr:MAG: hypothetical protein M1817_000192 [Caeruleum heppii]
MFAERAEMVGVIPPPPGVTANFIDPPYIGDRIILPVAICCTISTICLLLRIYTRIAIVRGFGVEDGHVYDYLLGTLDDSSSKWGYGRHLWDVPLSWFSPTYLQLFIVLVVVYVPAVTCSKIAILIFYHRISPNALFRVAIYIIGAITVGYTLAVMFALLFACQPVAKSWDLSITGGSCINQPAVYLANGILNVISDIAILILPMPMVWQLHIPKRQKFGVGLMFATGSLVCIVSIIRLHTLGPLLKSTDSTWVVVNASIWIIIEVNLALVCGCLSVCKPFLRRHLPILLGAATQNSNWPDGYGKSGSQGGSRIGADIYPRSGYQSNVSTNPEGREWPRASRRQSQMLRDDITINDDVEMGGMGREGDEKKNERGKGHAREFSQRCLSESEEHIMPNDEGIVKTVQIIVK